MSNRMHTKKGMSLKNKLCFLPSLFCVLTLTYGQSRSLAGDSRSFVLCPVKDIKSSVSPTSDAGRYGVKNLIDGKLPKDGWRSSWSVWMKKNPSFTFDLGETKRIGVIRIYFQPWDRAQELSKVKVEVSLDNQNFMLFNEYTGFLAEKGKATWAEIDLKAIKARYFRVTPSYDGWGHQWGEVEFWEIPSG